MGMTMHKGYPLESLEFWYASISRLIPELRKLKKRTRGAFVAEGMIPARWVDAGQAAVEYFAKCDLVVVDRLSGPAGHHPAPDHTVKVRISMNECIGKT